MRVVVILTVIVAGGVFLIASQKNLMGKAVSDVVQQTFKKVFGEKLHAAKNSPVPPPAVVSSSKTTTGPLNRKNLGILPLSNHVSTTVPLDGNTQCTLTPTLLEGGKLQIILTMETTGANGKPVGMNVARVLAHPGEPFDVSIANVDLAFTPQIAE